jgi:Holliday junction resolvasome RuvABC DNA-binding subunit
MSKQLEALNGLFQAFQEQMAEDANQAKNARENERTTLEQLGYMRLKAMNNFIEVIDTTIAALAHLKA